MLIVRLLVSWSEILSSVPAAQRRQERVLQGHGDDAAGVGAGLHRAGVPPCRCRPSSWTGSVRLMPRGSWMVRLGALVSGAMRAVSCATSCLSSRLIICWMARHSRTLPSLVHSTRQPATGASCAERRSPWRQTRRRAMRESARTRRRPPDVMPLGSLGRDNREVLSGCKRRRPTVFSSQASTLPLPLTSIAPRGSKTNWSLSFS